MENKDKEKLIKFVDEYKEIDLQINLMQKSIISLGEKRDKLIERLEDMKEEEIIFMQSLIKKYGPENITPDKLKTIYETCDVK